NKDAPALPSGQPSPIPSPSPSSSTEPAHHTKAGFLIIRVCEARNITLPPGMRIPPVPTPAQQAHSLQQNRGNRDSLTRKQLWWLPYVVLEFDKNEIIIDALGGDTYNPVWQYRAHFDVSRDSEVSISMYLRHPPNPTPSSPTQATNDFFLGGVKLQPTFNEQKLEDQWYNIVGGSGTLHVQIAFKPEQVRAWVQGIAILSRAHFRRSCERAHAPLADRFGVHAGAAEPFPSPQIHVVHLPLSCRLLLVFAQKLGTQGH
ncbi:hypothetical protein BC938DRAFT_482669, partial [Jimgerdemannia flammicorona]